MNKQLKIAVLMGGESRERIISLKTGQAVLKSLIRSGLNAFPFDPKEKSLFELKNENFELVFNALHGEFGEDGNAQAILEFLKIPYTGSGVAASALAMDKALTKRVWKSHNIETPPFRIITIKEKIDLKNLFFEFPFMLKPNDQGSSFGVVKVTDESTYMLAVEEAFKFSEKVLVEKFISGREFTCALIENYVDSNITAFPIVEIIAPNGEYNYENKYFGNKTEYFCPAEIPSAIEDQIKKMSTSAFRALGCEGWARVDLLWDGKNCPQLIEINTVPGMTDHSLVPLAASANNINFDELVLMILKTSSLNKKGSGS